MNKHHWPLLLATVIPDEDPESMDPKLPPKAGRQGWDDFCVNR